MATGQAVVLDNPRDPMSIVLMGQQQQALAGYRHAQLGQKNREAAQEEINKSLAHKYEKPEDRFREWGQNIINKANAEVLGVYQQNPNADPLQRRAEIERIKGERQKELDYGIETAKIYDEKQKSLANVEGILDKKEADRIMTQIIAKDNPFEVNRELLENIEQVPAIYDLNAVVADSVSEIKTQFRQVTPGEIQQSPLGLFMEVRDNKMRFKDMEKTIDFLLRGDDVTDLGIQQKINGGMISDRIRYNIAKEEVAARGGDPTDVTDVMDRFKEIQYDPKYAPKVRSNLKKVLEQFNQEDRDVDIKSMGQFKKQSFGDSLKENRIKLRDENLKNILKPFDSSGKIRPEAQAALPRILVGKFGGGEVTEADYERGQYTTSPEWTQKINAALGDYLNAIGDNEKKKKLQEVIKESQDHLIQKTAHNIKFSIKTGTIFGQPEEISDLKLDLSDPGTESIINALMNKNPGESNIPLDDVIIYRRGLTGGQQDGFLDDDEENDEGFLDD